MLSAHQNLPVQSTPFIGRSAELDEVSRLLANPACRLLTLVGPGGIGKTRLAIEAARRQEDLFPDGIFWVDLQPGHTADFLVTAVADALSLSLSGPDDPHHQLYRYLQDKTVLLTLDNFEQLQDNISFLSEILQHGPAIKLLVTSRTALYLREEWLYPVSGLPYPPSDRKFSSWDEVESFDAVQLFVEQVRRVRLDFSPSDEQAGLLRICRLVEGMPLALELAAAWARSLDCAAIAAEIERNLTFLRSNLRNVPHRHRSMEAVFAHSWTLLTAEERTVFPQLAIFRGGFRREAAETVAGATLPLLTALVDKSLLRWQANGRYQMHKLLRQFAEAQLAQSEEKKTATQERHGRYYAAFLQRRTEALRGGRQRGALAEIDAERENIRLAWQWAVDKRQVGIIANIVEPLNLYYDFRGHYLEGIRAFAEALRTLNRRQDGAKSRQAEALLRLYLGGLYLRVGRSTEAERELKHCRRLHEHLNTQPPPGYTSDPIILLGLIASVRGNFDEAARLGQKALQTAQETNHLLNQQAAYYLLARGALLQGQLEKARAHAQQSYTLTSTTGDRWFKAYCLNELGNVAVRLGDDEAARQHYTASYKIRREFRDPEGMALALSHLGAIANRKKDNKEAARLYGESLSISRQINNRGSVTLALQGLARNAIIRDEANHAYSLLEEALQLVREGRFVSLFLSLLVDIADLMAKTGDPGRAASLLTLVTVHRGSEPEARERAQEKLTHYWRGRGEKPRPALEPDAAWPALERLAISLQAELEIPASSAAANVGEQSPAPTVATPSDLVESLTKREIEVLTLIAEGLSNPEIAEKLVLAVGTVKYYTSEIYGKLGVRNRVEAARRARDLNLLP